MYAKSKQDVSKYAEEDQEEENEDEDDEDE